MDRRGPGGSVTTSVATADLADLVSGRAPAIDPAPFDPNRAIGHRRDAVPVVVDGVRIVVEEGSTLAAALMNAGIDRFRVSVDGKPRGALRDGVCHEAASGRRRLHRACLIGRPRKSDRWLIRVADVAVVRQAAGIAAATVTEAGKRVLVVDEGRGPA
jgi:hypothetical protein